MDPKNPSDHSVASAQKSPNVNRRDLPTLERFFVKVGFYDEAFLRL